MVTIKRSILSAKLAASLLVWSASSLDSYAVQAADVPEEREQSVGAGAIRSTIQIGALHVNQSFVRNENDGRTLWIDALPSNAGVISPRDDSFIYLANSKMTFSSGSSNALHLTGANEPELNLALTQGQLNLTIDYPVNPKACVCCGGIGAMDNEHPTLGAERCIPELEVRFNPKSSLILGDTRSQLVAKILHMHGSFYTTITGEGGVDEKTATQNLGHVQVALREAFFNHTQIFVDDERMEPTLGQVFRFLSGTLGRTVLTNVSVFSPKWKWKSWSSNASIFIQNVGVKDPLKAQNEVCLEN
jgi:hypothetical protein